MKRKQSRSIVPIIAGLGALSAIVFAQSGKPTPKAASTTAKTPEEPAVVQVVKADRKPLAYYTGGVRNDLFGTSVVEASKPAPKPAPAPAPKVETTPPAKVEPIDPFADYAYSGTVTMGNEVLALIENKKTREGQYVKIGESFMGGKVEQISERTVSIDVAGKPRTLAKSDDYALVPLNANAAFLDAKPPQPGQPQPGAPNMGRPGGNNFANMFQGGRPDWRNMSQEQREQMRQQFMQNMSPEQRGQMQQRRMDRQFEGGRGNRRGGFGGFGGFGG